MRGVTRRVLIWVLAGGVLLFMAIGPGLDWWRGRRDTLRLQPIVERFRAQGADLKVIRSTRSRASVRIRGIVDDETMKIELRRAVMDVFKDEERTLTLTKNVWTKAEFEALGP